MIPTARAVKEPEIIITAVMRFFPANKNQGSARLMMIISAANTDFELN